MEGERPFPYRGWTGPPRKSTAPSPYPDATEWKRYIPQKPCVAVCGAHLAGFPLHHHLGIEAKLIETTTTAPEYQLFALDKSRPALVHVGDGGVAIDVEVYELSRDDLWYLLRSIPTPLGLGRVKLADGEFVVGFICAHGGVDAGTHQDISKHGGWKAFKAMTDDDFMCSRTALEVIMHLFFSRCQLQCQI